MYAVCMLCVIFSLGTLWKFAEVLTIDIRELFTPIDSDNKND